MKLAFPEAHIASVTNLMENHGEELVPANSVKIEASCSPEILKQFSPALEGLLFVDQIPRIPEIGAIAWLTEYEKATFLIEGLEFRKADVSKIFITAKAGYLVDLSLSVKVHATPEEVGQLAALVKHDVEVTLSKLTQKKIVEDPKVEGADPNEGQGTLPGTDVITNDGKPIAPLQPAESDAVH